MKKYLLEVFLKRSFWSVEFEYFPRFSRISHFFRTRPQPVMFQNVKTQKLQHLIRHLSYSISIILNYIFFSSNIQLENQILVFLKKNIFFHFCHRSKVKREKIFCFKWLAPGIHGNFNPISVRVVRFFFHFWPVFEKSSAVEPW